MERQKNYEHFHYNAMGPMAESTGPANQMSALVSSGYDSANPIPVNYSVQTGEEFSLEFMRERANPRKISAQNASGDHSIAGCVGMRRTLEVPHAESKSGSDVLMVPAGEKALTNDLDSKNQHGSGHSVHYEAARSVPHASSANSSSYGIHGYSSSGASDSLAKKMKFLCSFGGKILPRPSDGKLRYAGGLTRMIRVSKDISWQEFVHVTMTIYNLADTIKYQLPGEDLDALVSVSCDEDLQNMMEECSIAAVGEGSQKLRMFLFSSGDTDDVQIGLGSMQGDSKIQYLVAVNGMDVQSEMFLSGHYQTTRSANDLDLLNLNDQGDKEVKKPNIESLSTNAATVVDATLSPFADPPASIQPDYSRVSHQVPFCGISVTLPVQELLPSKQGVITEGSSGGLQVEKETPVSENLEAESFFSQTVEDEQTGSSESEACRHFIPEGLASELLQAEELSYEASFQEKKNSVLASKSKDLLESEVPEEGLSPCESGIDNHKYELNNEGIGASCADHISGSEADIAEISYHDVPSHPIRGFHSENSPREQLDLANRLSKSNDSIGSQFLIPHSHSAIGQQESISECAESEKPSQSGKDSYFNIATVRDGLLQLEKCKEVAAATTRAHQLEAVSAEGNPQTMKLGHHSLFSTPNLSNDNSLDTDDVRVKCTGHTTNDQTVAAEDQSFKAGEKLQKSELLRPLLLSSDNNRTINDDKASLEDDKSRHHGSYLPDNEKGKMKVWLTGPADKNTELSGSTGIVSSVSKQENPTSGLSEVHWGNISTESMNSKEAKGKTPLFAWSVNSSGGASQPESSAYNASSQRKDILIDINDWFPHDLLSDLFYKARNNEDSVSTRAVLKDEAGFSVNIHNPEPKDWSFFRNLAQDEFKHKAVSLIDQDQIPFPSSYMNVEGGGPVTNEFSPLNRDADYNVSQIDFDEEIHVSSDDANDPSTIASLYIPSHAVVEGVQTEGPSRSPLSDYVETKLDNSIGGVPAMVNPLSDHDLQMIKNEDLEELRELGSGTFGTVYHGKWRGTDIAIKRIKKSCFVGRSSEQERLTLDFWREAEILSKLHHPNVVAFYGVVKDGPGGILATVTEYMVNGSLRHVLLRNDRYLDRRKRLILARDAAIGMEYLHSKHIVHFDLKCDNLLVNLKDPQRPICKVADFGLSKIKKNTLVSGGVRGTLPWMAPELLNDSSKVSEKVDVFSFGIVMWEILTGDEPYSNMRHGAIIGGIANNTLRPAVPDSCDPEWKQLMESCWAPDPLQRPSFTEISSHLGAMSTALTSRTPR